jgi:hypothetical protein
MIRALCAFAVFMLFMAIQPAPAQQANGKVRYLAMQPPIEYDKPYVGKLTIRRLDSEEAVMAACPKSKSKYGCAHIKDTLTCDLFIGNDSVLKAGHTTYAYVLRHELGHCNGWPGDHKDARIVPIDNVKAMPTLPADTRVLPAHPPIVCVTPE